MGAGDLGHLCGGLGPRDRRCDAAFARVPASYCLQDDLSRSAMAEDKVHNNCRREVCCSKSESAG